MSFKSIFIALFISFFTTLLYAQPIIQSSVVPDINGVTVSQLVQGDTLNVSEGNAGTNQIWSSSIWKPMEGTKNVKYQIRSPEGTPYAASFPDATTVKKMYKDTVVYIYYQEQANQFLQLGAGATGFLRVYSDPDAELKFPMYFNDSFQDDFAYTTDDGTGLITYTKGSRNTKYDAYGLLITPLSVFQNAMRIKSISSQVDSSSTYGQEIIRHVDITTYHWLLPIYPGPVASVFYTTIRTETRIPGFDTLITQSPRIKSVNYILPTVLGVFDPAPQLAGITEMKLGPNPASESLQLSFTSNQDRKNLKLELLNLQGKLVHTQFLDAQDGSNLVSLPVASFAPGTYFLTLSDGKGVQGLSWVKY